MNFDFIVNIARIDPGCKSSFLGFPHWYEYLEVKKANGCAPQIDKLNDFWLIGLAIVEILLRIAIFVAIAFVVYAGIKYSASRGNVDKMNSAKFTLLDALSGLVLAIVATAVVSFIAGSFSQT